MEYVSYVILAGLPFALIEGRPIAVLLIMLRLKYYKEISMT